MRFLEEFRFRVDSGENSYLVVSSKPIAAKYAEEMLAMTPSEGVLFNVPIYCFDDLILHLADEFGIDKKKVIDNFLKQIIVTDILNKKAIQFPNDDFFLHSGRPDFVMSVVEAIKDMKSAGLMPKKFNSILKKEPKHLRLFEIYEEYENFLAQNGLIDTEGLTIAIADLILKSDDIGLLDKHFYFQDIYALSFVKKELINSIASKVAKCSMLFSAVEDDNITAYQKHLESDLIGVEFEYTAAKRNEQYNIKVVGALDKNEEAAWITALIKKLVVEEEHAIEDICLVSNQSSDIYTKLSYNLKDAGIPSDMRNLTLLSNIPMISACLDLLSYASRKYDKIDVMKLYTHKVLGGGKEKVSVVHRKLKNKGLKMDLNTWTKKANDNSDFSQFLSNLHIAWKEISPNDKRSLSQLVVVAKRMFKALSVEKNILSTEDLDERAMLWSFWNEFMKILNDIESLDEEIYNFKWSFDEFVTFFKSLVSRKHIEMTSNFQKGLNVINPYDLFGQSFKILILSGMNEGDFPKIRHGNWLLTKSDREELVKWGMRINRGSDDIVRGKASFFAGLLGFSDELVITYSESDDSGEALLLSPIVEEIINSCGLEAEKIKNITSNEIISLKSLKTHVSRTLSIEDENLVVPSFAVDGTRELLTKLRNIYSEEFTRNDGNLTDEIELLENIKLHVIDEDIWSASTLKQYIECPFKFLCSKLLKIDEISDMEEAAEAIDLGTVSHEILNKTFTKFKGKYIGNENLCREYVDDIADDVFAQIDIDKIDINENVWNLEKDTLIRKIKDIVSMEFEFVSEGIWVPTYFEWSFGQDFDPKERDQNSTTTPLVLNYRGDTLRFKGIVDRIDTNNDGVMAIYDYKLGKGPEASDIFKKIDIQIALYILAVSKLLKNSMGDVAGGTYYSIREGKVKSGLWHDRYAKSLRASRMLKGNKLPSDKWFELEHDMTEYLGDIVSKIKTGNFEIKPVKPCDKLFCPYKDICGYDPSIYDKKR